MFSRKGLLDKIKTILNARTAFKNVSNDQIEREIVVHNASNVCNVLYTADRLKTTKPNIIGMSKLISGNYIRRQIIPSISTITDTADVIYRKFRVSDPVNLTDSIRLNMKAEQIIQQDPITTPDIVRMIYRVQYKFDGFVADISFVVQKNIKNDRGYKTALYDVGAKLKTAVGKKRMQQLKTGKSIDCLLDDFSPADETVRSEIEFEFIPGEKVDYDTLILLLQAADKSIVTPVAKFEEYLKPIAEYFHVSDRALYNKPIDLTRQDLPMMKLVNADPKGFAISYKKDGIRVIIMINEFGNVMIGHKPNGDVIRLPESIMETDQPITLIDAEFIEATQQYYAFDIVIFRGRFMGETMFPKRLENLADVISNDLSGIMPIEITEFIFPSAKNTLSMIATDLLTAQRDLIKKKTAPFTIDGLIYTPIRGTYTDTILRWKPENTIDFVVDFEKRFRKKFMYRLYSHAGSLSSRIPDGVSKIEIFNEYPTERFTIFKPVDRKVNRLLSATKLDNRAIYELAWRKNAWVVLRKRDDKLAPNFVKTARSIFGENILNPVLESEITNLPSVKVDGEMNGIYFGNVGNVNRHKLLKSASGFHNAIKTLIYNANILPGTRLLDIGSGRANDLPRWISKRFTKIVGVEYNADNIAQAMERISSSAPNLPVSFYNSGFFEWFKSKKADWKKYTRPNTKFDYVTVFFSSHYFLKDADAYHLFFRNLSKVTKPHGTVIVIDIDGKTIFDSLLKAGINKKSGKYRFGLEPTPTLDPSAYMFEMDPKQFKKKPTRGDFRPGIEVSAYVSTIGTINDEYLLDIDSFVDIGKEEHYNLISRTPFEDYKRRIKRTITIKSAELRTISYNNTVIVFEYNP